MTLLQTRLHQTPSQIHGTFPKYDTTRIEAGTASDDALDQERPKWSRELVTAGVIVASLLLWMSIVAMIGQF